MAGRTDGSAQESMLSEVVMNTHEQYLIGYVDRRVLVLFFFFQAEDGIRDTSVTGVQTCALPICSANPISPNASQIDQLRNTSISSAPMTKISIMKTIIVLPIIGILRPWDSAPTSRSEERRVGKECRCGSQPDHQNGKEMVVDLVR